ncbi:TPA: hypothetical protein ACH3X3_009170 [Trebouxia sp. C0006]
MSACVARLCAVDAEAGSEEPQPFCAAVLQRNTLELVSNSILQAVEIPLPWSTELCVALTRALWRIFDLFHAWTHMDVIKHGPGLKAPS